MTIPRDPSEYYPTEHAVLRKKKRGIEWEHVSEAIAEGKCNNHNDPEGDTCVFTKQYEEKLLYVAANHEEGAITSVWAEHKD